MKALLRSAKGSRKELKSISAPPCRSCSSSQPWFPPPRYWEADPNAGNASSPAPSRPNTGYGGGMQQQRGMVPPAPPSYVPGDFRPQQQQMPHFGAAMQHVPPPMPPTLPTDARTWNSGVDEPGGFSKLASFQQIPRMQSQPQQPPLVSSSISNTPPSNVSEAFTGLIESFHKRGMLLEVDNVLKGMRAAQIVASMPTYRALIDLYSQHGDFDRMDAVYLEMKRAMLKPPGQQQVEATPQQKQEASEHFGSLVDACHKKGLLEEISSIYRAMKAADLVISIPTYKILIETFSQLRDCEKMDAVYMEMREIMKKSAIQVRGIGGSAPFSQAGNPWTGFRQEVPGGFNPVARPPSPYGEPPAANRGQHPQVPQFQGPPHFQAMNHLQQQQQHHHPPPPPPYGTQQFQPGSVHGALQYPHQGHHPPSAVPPYASPPGQAGQVPFQHPMASVSPGYVPVQQFQAQQAPPSPVTAAAQMAAASVSAQQVQFQQAAAPVVVEQEEEGGVDETVEEERQQQTEEVGQNEGEEEQHQEVEASGEAAEEEEEQQEEQESIGEMEEVGHDTLESMVTGEQGNHEQQQQQLMESTG